MMKMAKDTPEAAVLDLQRATQYTSIDDNSRQSGPEPPLDWASWLVQVRRLTALLTTALQPFDLTLEEYEVLCAIKRGSMSQSAICDYTNHSVPSVSRRLQRLEIAGCVVRQQAKRDRRQFIVSLTNRGSDKLRDASRALQLAAVDRVAGPCLSEEHVPAK
jgi:DNA-binding MarR family transcriptional regulator